LGPQKGGGRLPGRGGGEKARRRRETPPAVGGGGWGRFSQRHRSKAPELLWRAGHGSADRPRRQRARPRGARRCQLRTMGARGVALGGRCWGFPPPSCPGGPHGGRGVADVRVGRLRRSGGPPRRRAGGPPRGRACPALRGGDERRRRGRAAPRAPPGAGGPRGSHGCRRAQGAPPVRRILSRRQRLLLLYRKFSNLDKGSNPERNLGVFFARTPLRVP